ncbi:MULTISPECIES: DUF4294 domain-containing protein [Myroides]|uniref:DUF4294 domain-containing protein n=1 Tax=Myroides albus TaxID=2562892 RepID=A0A6I3LQG3_9FLAO|nr:MULTISPECIES: DUF4294 domain-containing protein [Myroides]MTG98185.1 DUF4294 domain-containing protein [Myroides albus]MVX34365.1 DUF4294 domain-containing protein [Myroides sp. LoEW2-1]UVD79305.1 DUF4294 domain-containing protein [Myroides albus]
MKRFVLLIVCFAIYPCLGQEKELLPTPEIPSEVIIDGDTIQSVSMPEIFIGVDMKEEKYRRDMIILRNRIRRVYPYAKATAQNLIILNENLEKIESKRDKRTYIKRSQKYLEGQFKEKLKKLSRNDGKILLKLIDRETGQTAFQLIKEFKSGWTAFWSNTTARTFSLNLKSEYHPDIDLNDFYLETQLQYLFYRYEIEYSRGAREIKFNDLRLLWQEKITEDQFFPLELRE